MQKIQTSAGKWEQKETVFNVHSLHLTFDSFLIKLETVLKGESAYVCWAFSCATMVRTECRRLINYLFIRGKINEFKKNECLEYINKEDTHKEIRNLVMMLLLPKRLHFDGAHQAAFLRAAVSRVKLQFFFNYFEN